MNYNLEAAIRVLTEMTEKTENIKEKAVYNELISEIKEVDSIEKCDYCISKIYKEIFAFIAIEKLGKRKYGLDEIAEMTASKEFEIYEYETLTIVANQLEIYITIREYEEMNSGF